METTTLTDEQIKVYKESLTKLLKIKDCKINNLQYFPFSGKFAAVIEVKIGNKVRPIDAVGSSISKVANSLNDKYAGMVFCIGTGAALRGFSQKIERYFIQ
ncbi:MAG: hypothetical protein M0R37_11140 [Bacteroidales bacterium]|nr:hypothetical protein [Bacteroidales bacterium]